MKIEAAIQNRFDVWAILFALVLSAFFSYSIVTSNKLPILVAFFTIAFAAIVYTYVWHHRYFIGFIVFTIPLSIPFGFSDNLLSFPSELAVFFLVVVVILRFLFKSLPPRRMLLHPVSILLLADLAWTVFTCFFSSMPEVSVKRLIMKASFIMVFYFFLLDFFEDRRNIRIFLFSYSLGIIIPIISTLYNHSVYSFGLSSAFFVTQPFFPEHTIYAACLTICLITTLVFLFSGEIERSSHFDLFLIGMIALFLFALFLSYSRAAWISFVLTILAWKLLKWRLPRPVLVVIMLAIGIYLYSKSDQLLDVFERNRFVSSKTDLKEHVMSLTNVSNDASNAERLNRWYSAISMAEARSLTGFGPGTYQFQYGVYQDPTKMTRISTFEGDKGNAHSEYLNVLAESGLPGLLLLLGLLYAAFRKGIATYYNTRGSDRLYVLIAILSLLSYYLHGFVNSFIDSDKAASLVYSTLAIITLISTSKANESVLPSSRMENHS